MGGEGDETVPAAVPSNSDGNLVRQIKIASLFLANPLTFVNGWKELWEGEGKDEGKWNRGRR